MAIKKSSNASILPAFDELRPTTVTDQVFEQIYKRIIDLSLPPGSKLSEADVATSMGVSRQPVRDSFYRLSQLGLIEIRPQRATIVTAISEESILQARFLRLAIETACLREASKKLTVTNFDALDEIISLQAEAVSQDARAEFHRLDDQFHHDICVYSGLEFAWDLIAKNKGHMDRARYLSLSFSASHALAEHREILKALRERDADQAAVACKKHLDRIAEIFPRLRANNPEAFNPAS